MSGFKDRRQAGQELAKTLQKLTLENPVVVALMRGGVPVGYEIAKALHCPLDIMVTRKLAAPDQPELAIGAIVDGSKWEFLLHNEIVEKTQVSSQYLNQEIENKLAEIRRMESVFGPFRPHLNHKGSTILLVDDGIATGATVRVAIQHLKREKPKKIVVVTPVSTKESAQLLGDEVNRFICLQTPVPFFAVGNHYKDFQQVTDEDVLHYLEAAKTE